MDEDFVKRFRRKFPDVHHTMSDKLSLPFSKDALDMLKEKDFIIFEEIRASQLHVVGLRDGIVVELYPT